jgi:hypothetical protein
VDPFASCETVEDVGTKVDLLRPDDGSGFGIDLYLLEELHVFEGCEYTAATQNAVSEIEDGMGTISELQLERVAGDVADVGYSRGHL